jgi:hypothetical protein
MVLKVRVKSNGQKKSATVFPITVFKIFLLYDKKNSAVGKRICNLLSHGGVFIVFCYDRYSVSMKEFGSVTVT